MEIQDEFEEYFRRAAAESDVTYHQTSWNIVTSQTCRRGSLPQLVEPGCHLTVMTDDDLHHHRALSCKMSVNPRNKRMSMVTTEFTTTANNNSLLLPSDGLRPNSAPGSRSGSFKKSGRPKTVKDFREQNTTMQDKSRSRSGSVHLEEAVSLKLEQLRQLDADGGCVVRHFTSTKEGVINRGDSIRRKRDVTNDTPPAVTISAEPERSHALVSAPANTHSAARSAGPANKMRDVTRNAPKAKVLILGDHGVGKTSLLSQFMTSDFMGALSTTCSFEVDCEKTLSVLVNGEETMVSFVDLETSAQRDFHKFPDVDCYVLLFSITERNTFFYAVDKLHQIRQTSRVPVAVIMVANKSDLVRTRQVSTSEAKDAAVGGFCKYIEVSAALNHHVDELLVGVVSQIRLNPARQEAARHGGRHAAETSTTSASTSSYGGPLSFFKKLLFGKPSNDSKPCDNLMEL